MPWGMRGCRRRCWRPWSVWGFPGSTRHQGEALAAIRAGKNLLVATPTASGKTLIYNLPVLEALLAEPRGHALYLFPLKALEQDQLKALQELDAALPSPSLTAAIYDGDTPPAQRQAIKAKPPHVLITNPDMLHMGLMPYHASWSGFFARLKFVVIDEVHTYRGIMGSHMAQVLRRLRRICAHYGSQPQFILSSATIAQPEIFIRTLNGPGGGNHYGKRRAPVRAALSVPQPPGRRPGHRGPDLCPGHPEGSQHHLLHPGAKAHRTDPCLVPAPGAGDAPLHQLLPGRVFAGGAPGDRSGRWPAAR